MKPSVFKLGWRAIRIGGGIIPTFKLALKVLTNEGLSGVIWRLNVARKLEYIDGISGTPSGLQTDYNKGYERWRRFHEVPAIYDAAVVQNGPLISVLLPVYKPDLDFLKKAINSVSIQSYSNWELCIVDDASNSQELTLYLNDIVESDNRVKLLSRVENGHISQATNDALKIATGEWVALLDQDDELSRDALYYVAETCIKNPAAEIIYSDEDKLDERGKRHHPHFKPKFNPVLFLAQNMISHLGVYRRATLKHIGGFRVGVEGAQDWDLAFRVIEEKGEECIEHIPRVLYHWRESPGSTARDIDQKSYASAAQVRVVSDHLSRIGRVAMVSVSDRVPGMVRVRFPVPKPSPLVTIVVPTRDRRDLLEVCIKSIFDNTAYENFEIVVVDNGSVEPATFEYFSEIEKNPNIRIINVDIPFNYATLNNIAVAQSSGEFVLLLNNDIELTSRNWLCEMVSWAALPEIGCVGAKLWYPNGTLQHGGVILGIGGLAGHAHRGLSKLENGYIGRAVVHQNMSAVTGACLLVRRNVYEQVSGLDEQFAVAYNDIDFCLRVRAAGYQNMWTPFAEMIHHESATRQPDSDSTQRKRLEGEIELMKNRWWELLGDDPAYGRNLTRVDEDFSIGQ